MNGPGTLRYAGILLSGGTGTRVGGDIPKQYVEVSGRMILSYTLEALLNWERMECLVVVAHADWRDAVRSAFSSVQNNTGFSDDFLLFSDPGKTRQLSILSGLHALKERMRDDGIVMIHDAARPELSAKLIRDLSDACESKDADGAMPYLPVKDTVYYSSDGKVLSENLDRGRLFAGQTPEFFSFGKYLAANEALSEEEILAINGSSEPAVSAGMKIVLVPGDERNAKITTKEDMERFRRSKEESQRDEA